MKEKLPQDYFRLDHPRILAALFHPRPEIEYGNSERSGRHLVIPLEDGIRLGARFHHAGKGAPTILFFHGNGEIAADYDDVAPLFGTMGINFAVVDYRGYGRSTGSPTVTAMMTDCQDAFDFMAEWLGRNNYGGPLVIMGRSLGSAPALELAATRPAQTAGLILESGFARMIPLLRLLGVDPEGLGISGEEGCRNLAAIETVQCPTLIIHAQHDHIIPFADGEALYRSSPARNKRLVMIPDADHNSIFMNGFGIYMKAIRTFMKDIQS